MGKMSEADSDRQQIERLTDVVPPPSFAETARACATAIAPTPWEHVKATEHYGPYIVNAYGADVCDLYAMSNPMTASLRNGGTSFPIHFADAAANAAFIVNAVNAHVALVAALEKISGKREYDAEDHQQAAKYKPEAGLWTTDEYLADVALANAEAS